MDSVRTSPVHASPVRTSSVYVTPGESFLSEVKKDSFYALPSVHDEARPGDGREEKRTISVRNYGD